MKDIPKKDIKRRELSYKASLDTLKAVGIMPSPVQSQFITNINQEHNLILSPVIQEMLRKNNELMSFPKDYNGGVVDGEMIGEDDDA